MCERYLTVCKQPTKTGYTVGVNLKGEYLKNYGFQIGDMVKVELSENKIIISKESDIIQEMSKENPELLRLMNEFDLKET